MELNKLSPSRERDRAWRVQLLEDMAKDLRAGLVITATTEGKMCALLKDKIENHNYSKEDAWHLKEKQLFPNLS